MTKEEAIEILDPKTSHDALLPYAYDPDRRLHIVNEACRIACAALRTQYEDTGLEPEEIKIKLGLLEEFLEAVKGVSLNCIRELVQAVNDGRVVIIPKYRIL